MGRFVADDQDGPLSYPIFEFLHILYVQIQNMELVIFENYIKSCCYFKFKNSNI